MPILHAHDLNGPHPGKPLDEPQAIEALRDDSLAWVHLDGTNHVAPEWIATHLDYLDPQAIEALTEEETRPRVTILGHGILIILRGMNFNEGEDPEDMVSVRVWLDDHRIVTIARRHVRAIEDLRSDIRHGDVPADTAVFLSRLVERLNMRIADFLRDLDDLADDLETDVFAEKSGGLRKRVVDARLQVITARRYIAPQRDALADLTRAKVAFLSQATQRDMHEEQVGLTRIVEGLDELRDRLTVLREELSGQTSDRLNGNMYVISVLSAVFLPLSFLTGLFGVNVGGMPGVADGQAFLWLCLWMGGLFAVQMALLAAMRWLRRPGKSD
ncbi:Zinc transport protein ZntB [Aquimixticola soesokkakensis]|uniref:Zinc transport protein ZntB n=1 Tax=Aquimixticola soesokkakensis TaxID=1519096 RepID=A0A1Y5RKY4_9RHOB|nr:zinc transporter ZntB [Aquimixticola soesokkakensis]SLN18943.1 Zinc transport protein ZntB [Aquimixticola soesokkakensis]